MKNRLFFLIGVALLILVVWATTMIGISLNRKQTTPPSEVISYNVNAKKANIPLKF